MDEMEENERDGNTWHEPTSSTIATKSPDRVYVDEGKLGIARVVGTNGFELGSPCERISVEFLLIVIHFPPLAPCTEREDPI